MNATLKWRRPNASAAVQPDLRGTVRAPLPWSSARFLLAGVLIQNGRDRIAGLGLPNLTANDGAIVDVVPV